MFKNATVFRVKPEGFTLDAFECALSANQFVPCAPTQERSVGWIPPRAEHGAMVERVGDTYIVRLMVETKAVPAAALRRALDEKVKALEDATGRKPGKKERREIKDELLMSLLPHAFPRQQTVTAFIDLTSGLMAADTASSGLFDEFVTQLVRVSDLIVLSNFQTQMSPEAYMHWQLTDHVDGSKFGVGRGCELRALDESKAVVRYKNSPLDTEEVRQHLDDGKTVMRLDLDYQGRVSFTLDHAGALRGVKFMDVVFLDSRSDEDYFDADMAILTGELIPLITNLSANMGGLVDHSEGGAA